MKEVLSVSFVHIVAKQNYEFFFFWRESSTQLMLIEVAFWILNLLDGLSSFE